MKFIAVMLAIGMLISITGCSNNTTITASEEQVTPPTNNTSANEIEPIEETTLSPQSNSAFSLCYADNDTFNPYKCTSNLNTMLTPLLYDSLVRISPEYELEYIIARRITIQDNTISVQIKSDIPFSDGSVLSLNDVVYSFERAKEDDSKYKSQLSSVKSCTVSDDTIIFETKSPDSMGAYLLDFPIVKENSISSDSPATGSGRYKYVNDKDIGKHLSACTWWFTNTRANIEKILLVQLPLDGDVMKSVEIGTVGFYYSDLTGVTATRYDANNKLVDLNSIIYLGVNTNNEFLSKIDIRQAISLAIDRENISSQSYNSRASAASGPFTSEWYEANNLQQNKTSADRSASDEKLVRAGYSSVGSDSIRINDEGKRLSFKLIVNSGNEQRINAAALIYDQLRLVGIEVIVEELSDEDYLAKILAGDYDLYLGEYQLANNMDITPLFKSESDYYTGAQAYYTENAYDSWKMGEGELGELIDVFDRELPFIPIAYRKGASFYMRTLQGDIKTTKNDVFYNIQEWKIGR